MLNDLQNILEKVKNGDQAAFRKIVEEYRQQAFSVAFRITCNEDEARDAVQESFIKAWQKIRTYDMAQKFPTWFIKIVINTSIDRKRRMKQQVQVRLEDVIRIIDRQNFDPEKVRLENSENALLINWLAEKLPEKQRIIFILRDIQGMEAAEVCQVLNLPETSVKSNLYHARLAIREKLAGTI